MIVIGKYNHFNEEYPQTGPVMPRQHHLPNCKICYVTKLQDSGLGIHKSHIKGDVTTRGLVDPWRWMSYKPIA